MESYLSEKAREKAVHEVHSCGPSVQEAEVGELQLKSSTGIISLRSHLTITLEARGLGSMAQVMEHLPSKHKALNSKNKENSVYRHHP
jgi:hypothetical protein